jgi:hypothetical protein
MNLSKLLAHTEAALFRLGYLAEAPLGPIVKAVPADGLGPGRVTVHAGVVNVDALRKELQGAGLRPVLAGGFGRPYTILLWLTYHTYLDP